MDDDDDFGSRRFVPAARTLPDTLPIWVSKVVSEACGTATLPSILPEQVRAIYAECTKTMRDRGRYE